MSFYVVLPSNSSLKYFPSNTVTQYVTKLAKPLEFFNENHWEVALAEITFPNTLINVKPGENDTIYFRIQDPLIPSVEFKQVSIPPVR